MVFITLRKNKRANERQAIQTSTVQSVGFANTRLALECYPVYENITSNILPQALGDKHTCILHRSYIYNTNIWDLGLWFCIYDGMWNEVIDVAGNKYLQNDLFIGYCLNDTY